MSNFDGIPESVVSFVVKYIDSVEQLEILLLLFSTKSRPWEASQIKESIQSTLSSVEMRLSGLCSSGLVLKKENDYIYNGGHAEMDVIMEEVAKIYKEKRFRIIEIIFSKPIDKLKIFSDAFKIKKD